MSDSTKKIIMHSIISVALYLVVYASCEIALLAIMGSDIATSATLIFTTFPMMFTGNLLPWGLGYLAFHLYHKKINDAYLNASVKMITFISVVAIEFIGLVVYYANVRTFPSTSMIIIVWGIFEIVKKSKLCKAFKAAYMSGKSIEEYASENLSYEQLEALAKLNEEMLKDALKQYHKKGQITKEQMILLPTLEVWKLRDMKKPPEPAVEDQATEEQANTL